MYERPRKKQKPTPLSKQKTTNQKRNRGRGLARKAPKKNTRANRSGKAHARAASTELMFRVRLRQLQREIEKKKRCCGLQILAAHPHEKRQPNPSARCTERGQEKGVCARHPTGHKEKPTTKIKDNRMQRELPNEIVYAILALVPDRYLFGDTEFQSRTKQVAQYVSYTLRVAEGIRSMVCAT